MDEATKALMKQAVGITDEDLAKVGPQTEKVASNIQRAMQYKLVAEVTSSKYCFAGIKVGDKLVFTPFLNKEETTCPLCPRALVPVLLSWQTVAERLIEGVDPSDVAFGRVVACLDPGLEHGGLGHVIFRVYAEKVG